MFGIFFVGGSAYSGIGILAIILLVMRKVYHLEDYITRRHFEYLGYLLAVFAAVMLFFNISDFVVAGYKVSGETASFLELMFRGGMANLFWTYIWLGLVFPIIIIMVPRTRTITGIIVASVAANVGMFIERYVLVVGALRIPLNPYPTPDYSPSIGEWAIVAGVTAVSMLFLITLLKIFPPFSLWERQQVQQEFESGTRIFGQEAPAS